MIPIIMRTEFGVFQSLRKFPTVSRTMGRETRRKTLAGGTVRRRNPLTRGYRTTPIRNPR
jgi:hypothetical protein